MSDGLSLTADRPTRPVEEAYAPDPVDLVIAPDDLVEARDPLPVPVAELPAGSGTDRPAAEDTLVGRIRADARDQWDELSRLVEAVREWSPAEWMAAARERIVPRLPSACRAPFARGAATGPAGDGVSVLPGSPPLPSRWSAVVPERSALATRRHTMLLGPLPDEPAPRPRGPRPVLSAALAILLAGNAVGALRVVDTDQQVRPPDTTAAVVAAPPVRASAVPTTAAPRPSPGPVVAAPPPAATPRPAPTTPPRAAVPVRTPTARPAAPRRTSTATSAGSTSTKSRKSKKRHN